MGVIERIFHAILFEVLAVTLATMILLLFTNNNVGHASVTMIIIASIAMAWNVIFNWAFDKLVPGKREQRSMLLRVGHVILFQGGLLIFTIPVFAYLLGVTLWQAFMMDIGLTLAITVYAFLFNIAYDHIRAFIMKRQTASFA